MLIILSSRKRIKDRGIHWKEHYGEKSLRVKKKFDKILPHSYYRWEGFDYESGHPYYVVVGPAESANHGKSFFAGVKKMPRNRKKKAYSPSGKYFSSLISALRHAGEMWGIPMPPGVKNYTQNDLANIEIPKHVKG